MKNKLIIISCLFFCSFSCQKETTIKEKLIGTYSIEKDDFFDDQESWIKPIFSLMMLFSDIRMDFKPEGKAEYYAVGLLPVVANIVGLDSIRTEFRYKIVNDSVIIFSEVGKLHLSSSIMRDVEPNYDSFTLVHKNGRGKNLFYLVKLIGESILIK